MTKQEEREARAILFDIRVTASRLQAEMHSYDLTWPKEYVNSLKKTADRLAKLLQK